MTDQSNKYVGNELDLFKNAVNWKSYYQRFLRDSIHGDVLEVGAGLGGTTALLRTGREDSWTCLEPDAQLAARITQQLGTPGPNLHIKVGTTQSLAPESTFDSVLYIDVLEHIEDDAGELLRIQNHIRPNGKLIVLSPAYNMLFSPFDQSVGHFRRYTASRYRTITPPGLRLDRTFYLDSLGVILSLANRLLLRQASPTIKQVACWDNRIIPVSKVLDMLFFRSLGRSVIGVWTKTS